MSLFDAINAAAASLTASEQNTSKSPSMGSARVQPKSAVGKTTSNSTSEKKKVQPKSAADAIREAAEAVKPKAATKSAPKTDTPKTKGGAKYVIPASFKEAIENHLKGRADMKDKLNAEGKSIDGCCDYIFDVMRKRAEKERKGQSAVGLYAEPAEIFGLAVHYYDESEEALKAEANS